MNRRVMLKWMLLMLVSFGAHAQKFEAERAFVQFYSKAAIEDITAKNEKATALFDASSGAIAFVVPIDQFIFPKSLMQEHFNEKYLESERYPQSTFQGHIQGYNAEATGEQTASAQGKLTIHGVTRDVNIPGQIVKTDKGLTMKSKFMVELKDYKIEIPRLMWQNIAERVEVTIEFAFRTMDE